MPVSGRMVLLEEVGTEDAIIRGVTGIGENG